MPAGRTQCYMARKETFQPHWLHVDASGQVLGRLAVKIATVLMGKHRPTYTPHVDTGDFVVVTNAEQVKLTGNKINAMTYDSYSFYPGGFKRVAAADMMKRHPDRILQWAVRRMLPKNAMGRRMMKKLKIFTGPEHTHSAQQPEPWTM